MVLHSAASPISIDLDPEILILLQELVDLKSQVVLAIAEQNPQQLVVTHLPQLLVGDVAE
jgi:hypothetical protein